MDGERSLRGVLVALCVTVVVSYGVLFYAFPVMLPLIAADTGWSQSALTAAFSACLVTGGVVGVPAGRVIQRRGPRGVMVTGSVVGPVAVLGIAWSPSYAVFLGAWVLAGAASAGLFYAPAFAALTGWFGTRSVQAITTLTLAAGFASTIFAPLADALAGHLGWRTTYVVLAGVLLVVTLPAHALALDLPWPMARSAQPGESGEQGEKPHADRHILLSRTFVLATAAGTLMAFAAFASLVNLVPLLIERGLSSTWAAWALGLGGAGQVAGRVFYPAMTRTWDARTRAILVIVAMGATLAGLAIVPGPTLVLVLLAVLAGAARGLFTLVGATLVSDYWGPERYAAISGVYNAPILVASALSPWLGAVIAEATGGQSGLFVVLVATAVVAAALTAGVQRGPAVVSEYAAGRPHPPTAGR